MSVKRIAVFGDVHGCIDELEKLYSMLTYFSLDQIHSVGDLVDRGPNSGAVVDFCRQKGVIGVMGNHESILKSIAQRPDMEAGKNPDKARTIKSIRESGHGNKNFEYLFTMPYLRAIDDLNLIIVHAGIWPNFPIYMQANIRSVCHAQAVNPDKLGDTVWYDKMARKNQELGKRIYVPWQDVHNHAENVVYGHSVYCHPNFKKGAYEGAGWSYGIDTGVPFGGSLTAIIIPDMVLVQVPAKRVYWDKKMSKDAHPVSEPHRYGGYGE